MATGAYEYLSDDGTTYQVVLPTELASSLGYVPASGFEPYVPSYLQMRYATYQSVPSNLSLVAPVTFPFMNGVPPASFSVGGQIYFVKSLYGESRNANVNQMIQTISGPQGAPGANGTAGPAGPAGPTGAPGNALLAAVTLTATQIMNLSTNPVTLIPAQSGTTYPPMVLGLFIQKIPNTVAYNTAVNLEIQMAGSSILAVGGFINTNLNPTNGMFTVGSFSSNTDFINHPVVITASGPVTTGNSQLNIQCWYQYPNFWN